LSPRFEDCRVDDILDKPWELVKSNLDTSHWHDADKKLEAHNTARFRELVSLNEGDDSFADVPGIIKEDLASFSITFLRGQILCKVIIRYVRPFFLAKLRTCNTVCHCDDVLSLDFLKLSKLK
jgi:hypothetical protein